MKSIMQNEKECYLTGAKTGLHEHHIFGGSNRKLSEKYGLKIWLTYENHIGENGIHFNKEFSIAMKQEAQRRAMQYYNWTKEEFIKIFGRNYL